MALAKKISLINIVLVSVFLGSNYLIQKQIIFPTFANIEQQHAKENIDRVEELLYDSINQVDRLNYDWSSWDDTYQFIQDRNQEYIVSNLGYGTFENMQIDFVYFYNMEHELVWGEVYETREDSTEIITSDHYTKQSYASLKPYIESINTSLDYDQQYSKGLILLDNVPVIFSIRSILTSEGEGPTRGYIVQGKRIDDRVLKGYQQQIKINFSIDAIDTETTQHELSTSDYTIRKISDSSLDISKYFFSNDQPLIKIATYFPRDITHNGITSINYALYTLFAVGFFSIVIIFLALRGSVLKPISTLTKQILKISKNKDYTLRSNINSNDEIGILAKEFNHMLSMIEHNNSELKHAYAKIKGDHQKIVEVETELRKANAELKQLAITDPLTGIANRLSFETKLKEEWKTLTRSKQPLSVMMIDIDYFKPFNDHYGHQAGDECLKQVAGTLTKSLRRPNDLVARYGGEEFIVILPNNDIESAQFLASSIQQEIANCRIEHRHSKIARILTVSIGISSVIPSDQSSIETLINQADSALYKAKNGGRNRVEI